MTETITLRPCTHPSNFADYEGMCCACDQWNEARLKELEDDPATVSPANAVAHGRYMFERFHHTEDVKRLDMYGRILAQAAHDAGVPYFDMFGTMSKGAEVEYLAECKRAGDEPEAIAAEAWDRASVDPESD